MQVKMIDQTKNKIIKRAIVLVVLIKKLYLKTYIKMVNKNTEPKVVKVQEKEEW